MCCSGKLEPNFKLFLLVLNFENKFYFPLTVIAVKTHRHAIGGWPFLSSRRRQNDLWSILVFFFFFFFRYKSTLSLSFPCNGDLLPKLLREKESWSYFC